MRIDFKSSKSQARSIPNPMVIGIKREPIMIIGVERVVIESSVVIGPVQRVAGAIGIVNV